MSPWPRKWWSMSGQWPRTARILTTKMRRRKICRLRSQKAIWVFFLNFQFELDLFWDFIEEPEASNGHAASDLEESEEDELTLMGSIKAGKDGKPIKSAKIKKKKKLSEEERDKIQHTEEVCLI